MSSCAASHVTLVTWDFWQLHACTIKLHVNSHLCTWIRIRRTRVDLFRTWIRICRTWIQTFSREFAFVHVNCHLSHVNWHLWHVVCNFVQAHLKCICFFSGWFVSIKSNQISKFYYKSHDFLSETVGKSCYKKIESAIQVVFFIHNFYY